MNKELIEEYFLKRNDIVKNVCVLLNGCSVSIAKGILKDAIIKIEQYAIDVSKPEYSDGTYVIYENKSDEISKLM